MRRISWILALAALLTSCTVEGGSGPTQPTATPTTTPSVALSDSTTSTTSAASTQVVALAFGVAGAESCSTVAIHEREVPESGSSMDATFVALVAGPTPQETEGGAQSFFSDTSAGLFRSTNLNDGLLTVDFDASLPSAMNNASTTCGSEHLLAELTTTAFEFEPVSNVTFTLDGDCSSFFTWLQRECQTYERP